MFLIKKKAFFIIILMKKHYIQIVLHFIRYKL
jgi:hypothetical protein